MYTFFSELIEQQDLAVDPACDNLTSLPSPRTEAGTHSTRRQRVTAPRDTKPSPERITFSETDKQPVDYFIIVTLKRWENCPSVKLTRYSLVTEGLPHTKMKGLPCSR